MSLSDLASLGSFVSGVAVLISLIYLALQVRQAEKNQRALTQQGRADRAADLALRLADPTLGTVWAKGMRRPEDLSAVELDQFLQICRANFLSAEDSFLQHKAGQLDEAAYASFVAGARIFTAAPGIGAAWRQTSALYGSEFAAFMDGFTAKAVAGQSETEMLNRWITNVQAVRSRA